MSPVRQGFLFAFGVWCFVVAWLVLDLLGDALIRFMSTTRYYGPAANHEPMPSACPTCGWRPAIYVPDAVLVHLEDGTHDTEPKENP